MIVKEDLFETLLMSLGRVAPYIFNLYKILAASAAVFCTQPHVILLKHREI